MELELCEGTLKMAAKTKTQNKNTEATLIIDSYLLFISL